MQQTKGTCHLAGFRRGELIWVVLTVMWWSLVPSVSLAQAPTATMVTVNGEVLVSGQPVTIGTVVQAGDTIQTQAGAFAEVEFADGSVIRISENTQVTLTEFIRTSPNVRTSRLTLLYGRLRALLSAGHQTKGSAFTIDTPNAVIGVKFSQPDVEVSYDPATQETIGLAHTVELLAKNLLTDEEIIVPVGSTVIIVGTTIKIVAGIVALVGTSEAGTVGAGTTAGAAVTETTTGMSTGTLVAIGAGVAAVAGGAAVAVASSSDEDTGNSGDDIDWENPFTGTFKFEGRITFDDPNNTPADAILIYYLTQQGNTVTGTEDAIMTACCTFTDTSTATGNVDGTTMVLITTVISSTECTCPDGTQWRTPIGMNWTHTCTLLADGSGFQFENGMVFLRQ